MQMTDELYKNIGLSVLLFPLVNIALSVFGSRGNGLEYAWHFLIEQLAICIAVAFAEELFFRGLLLRELVFSFKVRTIVASLLVSFVFGILHLVNVNSYATWCYAIVQSLCAFAVSFNLSAIFVSTQRLWICVLIHALINITSIGVEVVGNSTQLVLSNMDIMTFLLVSFIYLVSGVKIMNQKMVEGR